MISIDAFSTLPDQIKVYNLKSLRNRISGSHTNLLHRNFSAIPIDDQLNELLVQIADYLKALEPGSVYSFFSRYALKVTSQWSWLLSSAHLHIPKDSGEEEIVVFTYDLDSLGDIKPRLYNALESQIYFQENFNNVSSLTRKEREIVGLLASGLNSREIAQKIYISVHTVNTHRKRIIEKLGIKDHVGLLKYAEAFGLSHQSTTTP
ncbi:response regulator transcription factor [Flavitalea sp.]|nr:helix-turn-helix transcriptional regulator [Flavitalea sp.]